MYNICRLLRNSIFISLFDKWNVVNVSLFNPFEYIPNNVLMTLDPVFDCAANHDFLFLAQTIWINQIWRDLECTTPFGFRGENVSIVFTVEFYAAKQKKERNKERKRRLQSMKMRIKNIVGFRSIVKWRKTLTIVVNQFGFGVCRQWTE